MCMFILIFIHVRFLHTYICTYGHVCVRMNAINFRHAALCYQRDSYGALTAHMLAVLCGHAPCAYLCTCICK